VNGTGGWFSSTGTLVLGVEALQEHGGRVEQQEQSLEQLEELVNRRRQSIFGGVSGRIGG
jgi:hypothetical protein